MEKFCYKVWVALWTSSWCTALFVTGRVLVYALGVDEFNATGIPEFAFGVFFGSYALANPKQKASATDNQHRVT